MKNLITYLKALWGAWGNLQSKDVSLDCRLTVGSPSGLDAKWKQNPFMRFAVVLTLIFTIGSGNVWGAEEVYKETIFNSTNNSGKAGSYSNSWYNTTNSFRVNITNANNNNNGWEYVKIGSKSSALTGTFITNAIIDQKITKVSINIGAITTASVTSIKLYTSTNKSSWTERGTFTKATGWKDVTIAAANQANNYYYKIEAVCAKASSNGPLQINGIRFYKEAGGTTYTVTYNKNNASASGTMTDSNSPYASGATVTVLANGFTAPSGKVFSHWDTKADDSGTDYAPGATFSISGNTTLYAQWATAYTITYNLNGGTGTTPTESAKASGATFTLHDGTTGITPPTKKVFSKWRDQDGTDYEGGDTYTMPSKNVTLTAQWVAAGGDYVLVEDAGDIGPGKYLIVYNNTNALNTHYGNVNANTYATYTNISSYYSNKKIASNATTDALAYTVAETTNGYSISHKESGTTYYLGNSSNSTGAYLRWDNPFTASTDEWTLGVNSIVSARNSNYAIRWNNNSSSYRFAIYNPTGQQAVQLFKQVEACEEAELAYSPATETKTYGDAAFTKTLTNSHSVAVTYSSSDPTVATVNGSGQVTILKAGSTTITASSIAQTVSTVDYCADEASYTLTVNKANISPTLTYTPSSVAAGSSTSAPTVGGNPGGGGVTYAITSATPSGCATINTSTGVVSGEAVGSVTVTATVAATTNYNGGTATANVTITAASGYCISAFNSSNNGITSGFSNGGSGNEYTLSYTIPGKDGSSNWPQYWIGENEAWASFSANALFADMRFTHSDATLGLAEGATGKLHIWDDNKASGSNLWVKFEPDGYGFRWGGTGEWDQAANTKAFTVDPGNANTYWTEIVTLDGTNNTTWNYYVGLQSASGYVYSGVDNEASDSRGISRTRSVTTMKVSNGTAGSYKATYLNSEATGTRGKFRIWDNNISDHNFVCHFVPYYRVTYNGSGASGSTDPSADVSCEGDDAARTVVAAANGFTVPTGKTFGGWASSPENAAAGVVAYAAGANVVLTSSITLYAIWTDINYTVTVNQSPAAGATTTGQTSSAHYNGTINLTTTVPSGYRFVNWTTSDGFSITNPTSATTASFTMPAKNVTVTANFQQTHKVDWYVGGSAVGNKLDDDGQTTVVDHGGKISDFPATTPDGSACDKEFVGWTNTSSYVHGTSPLFNDVAGSPTINADASFYAVFAEVNVATGYTYIGDEGMLEAGETYIFVSSKSTGSAYALKSSDLPQNNTSGVKGTAVSVTVATGIKVSAENSDLEFTCSTHTEDEMDVLVLGSSANTLRINGNGIGYGDARAYYDNTGLYGWNNKGDTYYDVYYNSTSTKFEASSSASGRVYAYKKGGTTYTGHTITCADCGTSVMPTYTAAPTGGTVSVTKSAAAVASGSTVKTCTSVDLTVTITPATHYTLTGFTATGLTTGTATITPAVGSTLPVSVAQTFTVTVSAGATGTLTLAPTFTAQTPLSITLETHSKGTFTPIGDIYSGESFTFPTVTPSDAECSSFLGWIEGTTWSGDGTETDPTAITGLANYHAAGSSSGTLTTTKTYTAVFGEKDTQVIPAYQKVTSAPSNWSGDYLIVRDANSRAFDGSLSTLDAADNYIEVTISEGSITANSTVNASKWTIAKVGATSNYTIKSASGYYIGRTASSNGLNSSTSEAYTNTLSYSDDHVVITSSGGPTLQMNSGTRFRYYTTSQQALQLYKYNPDAEVVSYTYTTNPACTPRYRVTISSATGGSPEADKTYEHADETITITANPAAGYSFTSWTITKTTGGDNVTSTLLTGDKPTTANTTFTMPAYDITIAATYTKKMVSTLEVKDGATVVSTTTGPVSGTVNISTGANKTLDVVITPSDAYDHSWTATVSAGSTYASITNVTDDGFRVNGLAQGDATITVNAPNDGSAKSVTLTVQVRDIMPEEIILKRDGSNTPIETLIMYYDETNSKGQYVKVNVGYSPANPTNKAFTFSSALTGKVGSHSHAPASGYEVLVANGVTSDAVNCTFTSSADGSVTKVLAVTVLPILSDRFVDYVHGNATQTVSARLSDDRYSIIPDINTPSLSDASDSDPTSEDCETAHYHLVGWLPQTTAEALWAAGTPITDATEGLVRAGESVEATGQTWCAIWAEEAE